MGDTNMYLRLSWVMSIMTFFNAARQMLGFTYKQTTVAFFKIPLILNLIS
jgi:hypothetical protein